MNNLTLNNDPRVLDNWVVSKTLWRVGHHNSILAIKIMVSLVCYSFVSVKVLLLLCPPLLLLLCHLICHSTRQSQSSPLVSSNQVYSWHSSPSRTSACVYALALTHPSRNMRQIVDGLLFICAQWECIVSYTCCESLVACARQKQWILAKVNLLHVRLMVDCTIIWLRRHCFSKKQTDGTDGP